MTPAAWAFLIAPVLVSIVLGAFGRAPLFGVGATVAGIAGVTIISEWSATLPALKTLTSIATGAIVGGITLTLLLLVIRRAGGRLRVLTTSLVTIGAHATYLNLALAAR